MTVRVLEVGAEAEAEARTLRGIRVDYIDGTVAHRIDQRFLVLDHGLLQVFDEPPEAGGLMILSRTVQRVSDTVTHEDFLWRPRTAGPRVLHVVTAGTRAGPHPSLQIPVVIEER